MISAWAEGGGRTPLYVHSCLQTLFKHCMGFFEKIGKFNTLRVLGYPRSLCVCVCAGLESENTDSESPHNV